MARRFPVTPRLSFPAPRSAVLRVPGGTITGQFATSPGPAPKPIAITGGTGRYRNVGGEWTLVEFANRPGPSP